MKFIIISYRSTYIYTSNINFSGYAIFGIKVDIIMNKRKSKWKKQTSKYDRKYVDSDE